ncbi:MAG: aminotransferase class I and II [Chloroflexi bacterium]|nr:aminotransferase class I and II [Chloroflexota bacterium]
MVRTLNATRYITPLREGGSMPAIVETDDGGQYVMKFVGAGQGRKALIAEWIAGEIGRALDLRVPDLAFIELDAAFAPSEPDPEIYDLLRMSVGLNLGLRYLPGAFAFNPVLKPAPDAELASRIVWFDAFVTNIDRTARNTNLLWWQKELWLIDHGASLYFHHRWGDHLGASRTAFSLVQDHVLLRWASALSDADAFARARLNQDTFQQIVARVPDAWLGDEPQFANLTEHRRAYVEFLVNRLESSAIFLQEAKDARARRV